MTALAAVSELVRDKIRKQRGQDVVRMSLSMAKTMAFRQRECHNGALNMSLLIPITLLMFKFLFVQHSTR